MGPLEFIINYEQQQFSVPLNRFFFDYGEEQLAEAVLKGLTGNNKEMLNTLHFLNDSLYSYRKQSWKNHLNTHVKQALFKLIDCDNYFARVRAVELLNILAANDLMSQNTYFEWLRDQFFNEYNQGSDPLLLYTIFCELDTKEGGMSVHDYQLDMISKLIHHQSPAMSFTGLACFDRLQADSWLIPEEMKETVTSIREKYPQDFLTTRQQFENQLKQADKYGYTIQELEEFIKC